MRLQNVSAMFLVAMLLLIGASEANLEGEALTALKKALVDPHGVLDSWDPSLVNPCTWFRITCDSDNFVTRIDLEDASLQGSLVPQIASLGHLQYLELNNNLLTGPIPHELGELEELVSLDLYDNHLTGRIPETLSNLQSLKFLRLNGNLLSGPIPESLARLSNLRVLDLSDNNLSGRIPDGGPFSSTSARSFQGNSALCGPRIGRECR